MILLQKLKNKYLQAEQKVKQRTHAIDLLVSGQTEANQRSIANRDNIRKLKKQIEDNNVYTNIHLSVQATEIKLMKIRLAQLESKVSWLVAGVIASVFASVVISCVAFALCRL